MKYRLGFDVIDRHQRFELIHPFQDGNGRVGRLVMFKECLANGIVPFIITGGTPQQYEKKLNIARTERVIIQRGRDESFVPVAQNNVSDKVCKNMENDRILLRPWLESDAPVLFKYASDPEVGPRAGWPPHKSVEESLEIIRTVFKDATCTWAILLKETGEPIGAMGYGPSCQCNLPAREGEPLIGYWVARPYWNLGICTEALRLMIAHIRQTTEIKSLISGHFIDNPASGRVMEKCGFIPTGETIVDPDQGRETPIRVLRLEL